MSRDRPPLLQVDDLAVRFPIRRGTVHAVNGISYHLEAGESLAIVGESGSGKTVGALALLGLVPLPGRVTSGSIRLRGRELVDLDPAGWRSVRGREIAMVFQDPMTSLNPVLPVGRQITEALTAHLGIPGREADRRAVALLTRVGIPDAARRASAFPHEFSGGQRQRIMIAMALACEPAVLVADEPTTALDVTVQAQIVRLVQELQADLGMGVLWITHDLALVAGFVDRVAVMYAGRIVEEAPTATLFANPRHPYTRGLLGSMPSMVDARGGRLSPIPGRPPELLRDPDRCALAPRCPHATDRCIAERPTLMPVESGSAAGGTAPHRSACWYRESL